MLKTPRIRKGMTVSTIDGEFVIRHINREIKPPLILMSEKHKPRGRRVYIRANALEYSLGHSND